MQGKIIKGIAGFYYVFTKENDIFECKAKGIFRNEGIKPLVGDEVSFVVLDEVDKKGNIEKILPRRNVLVRPAVANIDQAMIIFSLRFPNPSFNLLDRFLIMMEQLNLPTLICFNKEDLVTEAEKEIVRNIYKGCGYPLLFCSALNNSGLISLKEVLRGKTTSLAGPSGVGKSTLVNALHPLNPMDCCETGEISKKIQRGKHTTRHTEIIAMEADTFIMDTPGFTSLNMFAIKKEELSVLYPDFKQYEKQCKFAGCSHIHEPNCGIKDAVAEGNISTVRYDNYKILYEELNEKRKY